MRLKSLRLAGFKSFSSPTTFSFAKNITAIVGPNGCGKSNVIDAIRWVLGETSAKQLRGGAMSDVIFAGTQDKASKSLASVELTFEHTQDKQTGIRHELNLYHELSVRRQINREGKSDYFINGTRCRRRDVVDIFLGTGLGARSYAVIEQGMIGRIVDSSPMQLREFIEEGAGVSRYQARRIETQKKLTLAEENLSRLNDLKSELEKQQKTLTRQAETSKRYKELTTQLQKLEQDIAIHQMYTAKYDELYHQKEYKQIDETLASLQDQFTTQTTKLDKVNSLIAEQQWLKDDARDKYHHHQLKLQQAEHALSEYNTHLVQLTEKQTSYIQQEQDYNTQLKKLNERHQLDKIRLADIEPQLNSLKSQKTDIKQQLIPLNQQWQEIHIQQETLQTQQRYLEKQHALAEQAYNRLQIENDKLTKRQVAWQLSWDSLSKTANIDILNDQIKDHQNKLTNILKQRDNIEDTLETNQKNFLDLKEQVNQAQNTLQTLEKNHTTLHSEYNTLHSLVFTHNKPKLITTDSKPSNKQQPNLSLYKLSDKIELTKQGIKLVDILDTWLSMWLDTLLLFDSNSSPERTKLYQLVNEHTPSIHSSVILHSQPKNHTDIKPPLISINQLIQSPKLALWQQAYLLIINDDDNVSSIPNYIDSLPVGSFILTSTGWIIGQFGMMHLSKLTNTNHDSHFLQQRQAQKSRLAELEDELTLLESEIDNKHILLKNAKKNHDELQIIIEELTAQINNLLNQKYEHHQAITKLTSELERLILENQRLDTEKQQLEQDKLLLNNESQQLNSQLQSLNQQIPKINEQLIQIGSERSQLQDKRNNVDIKNREIDDALQSINLQYSQLLLSIQHIEEQQQNLKEQLTKVSNEKIEIDKNIETLGIKFPALDKAVKTQQLICHEEKISLEEYQKQLQTLQIEYTNEREIHEQEQIKIAKQQQQLSEVTTKLAIAKERLSEACNRVDHIYSDLNQQPKPKKNFILNKLFFVPARYPMISQNYQIPYQNKLQSFLSSGQDKIKFLTDKELIQFLSINDKTNLELNTRNQIREIGRIKPNLTVSSASLLADFILHKNNENFDSKIELSKQQQRQQDYQFLQIKIGRIGAVNLVAIEELEQVNERLEMLTAQTNDILLSMKKLTDAIHTIDNKTKELFLQTLESVNKDLLHLFNKVFGGGQASLTLIDDANLPKKDKWRAGLEFMAQPKGKKNSRLAVLSGGEKTLTALSLIFAIFKQHPAPFCVLDEVDAPLDDANVSRFTGLIEELANDLQFIFISHNKLSMQIADELKGITMPTPGVSSLVSVSLDEAEQYIEA